MTIWFLFSSLLTTRHDPKHLRISTLIYSQMYLLLPFCCWLEIPALSLSTYLWNCSIPLESINYLAQILFCTISVYSLCIALRYSSHFGLINIEQS